MKTCKILTLTLLFLVTGVLGAAPSPVRYVFLFIGDGMATPQRMIAEAFSRQIGRGPLALNHLPVHGTTRTCSANALITDSAAAGTAIACGEKTNNGRIGMDVSGQRRLTSVAEVAQQRGKKVGIISSVTINHATPASFYAHRPNRSQYYAIGLDLVNSKFDFFGGGGFNAPDDRKSPFYRGNLYTLAQQQGFKVTATRDELHGLKVSDLPVLARGSSGILPYEIDHNGNTPHLAEFTQKAIELLDNPHGFFIMVEGGSIDWCGHRNDGATNLREVIGLDNAVKAALKFARRHPQDTLIIVTGDHETGGMTMGFAGTGSRLYLERLGRQKISVVQFDQLLKQRRKADKKFDFTAAQALLTQYFGLEFQGKSPLRLTKNEIQELQKAFQRGKLADQARIILNHKSGVGWTSGAHTALPVLTTSSGARSAEFSGYFENTEIARRLKKLL